ncbi:transglycosylase SLT domain-containing protein [Hydrogenophaga sp. 5NK40-0174]|uniref:lytic transglycosylase domain-containing protein n=1 Tax=Hydrogenophaga sp. 5NK40-0174 TaxID=3127649 RepID=UPI00310726C4
MAAFVVGSVAHAKESAQEALTEMRKAYYRQDVAAIEQRLDLVRDHPLASLADYWAARLKLQSATQEQVRAVLDRHPGTYWQDRLRNDWLLELGRRQDWTHFLAELPEFRMNDDPQVRCYALMLEHQRGETDGDAAADEVRDLWHAQSDKDEGCGMAAGYFLQRKLLSAEDVWVRARLAMEARQYDAVTQAIGLLHPDQTVEVGAIGDDPEKYLDGKLTALRAETKEMVTLALVRLAARDNDAAIDQLQKLRWRSQLTEPQLQWAWAVAAKWSAKRGQPEALDWFGKSAPGHMSTDHLEWKIRSALRNQNWQQVQSSINALPASVRESPVWVYWRARAIEALAQPDAEAAKLVAQHLYASVAGSEGFYEQLSTEALGLTVTVPPAPAPLTELERSTAERHPGLQRALTAMDMGFRSEGVREWHYSVRLATPGGMNDRELLAAADLACRREIWDRCINTSRYTVLEQDFAQRFPLPQRSAVIKRADAIDLPPAYVYGLIRQESRFVTAARSSVGASGLMQVMPATARWTAKKIGMEDFRQSELNSFDTNLIIGTAYLKLVLDDFEGSLPLAAAGYNAGPRRPRVWRNGALLDGDVWVENISFDETRDYVRHVLANTTSYAAILTGKPQSLRARLGKVGPRNEAAPQIDRDLP